MSSALRRGLLAGAAGTTALNVFTYADMAWRGRDASSTPEDTAEALAHAFDVEIPGSGREHSNRVTALGALLGSAGGLAVGVGAAAARSAGFRLPAVLDAALTGAAAMAATDLPMALLGVSDPADWSTSDWVSDAVPHLVYGAATAATLRAMDGERPVRRAGFGLLVRSALLGVATGSRSSLGLAAPTLSSPATPDHPDGRAGGLARVTAGLGVATELVADKLPGTPARTSAQGLPARFAAAVAGSTVLARRQGANATAPVVAGALGAAAGSWGGLAWRRWASSRLPDWQAAIAEDVVALGLAALACRGGAAPRPISAVDLG